MNWVRKYGTALCTLITLAAQTLGPNPACFDCEYENPWGYTPGFWDAVSFICAMTFPVAAGVLGFRFGWTSPILVMLSTLVTQPLGGVPLWSLRENERPIIVIFGLPILYFLWAFGWALRWAIPEIPAPLASRKSTVHMDD